MCEAGLPLEAGSMASSRPPVLPLQPLASAASNSLFQNTDTFQFFPSQLQNLCCPDAYHSPGCTLQHCSRCSGTSCCLPNPTLATKTWSFFQHKLHFPTFILLHVLLCSVPPMPISHSPCQTELTNSTAWAALWPAPAISGAFDLQCK